MSNQIPPHLKAHSKSHLSQSPKQFRSYDPRRWGQWVVQLVSKPKIHSEQLKGKNLLEAAITKRKAGDSSLYDRSVQHITNPEVANKMLSRQKEGAREPVISEKMTTFREIGQGAFGKADMVFPDQAGPMVVRKQALGGSESELRKEEKLLNQLDHPNIVKASQAPHKKFKILPAHHSKMHMEYGGANLKNLTESGPCSQSLVKKTMGQLVDAVVYLKKEKVIHFDIKPDNVLINPNDGKVLLADFGVAQKIGVTGSTDLISGTMGYSAPEIENAKRNYDAPKVTPSADVFSTGCVMFEMITGKPYLPIFVGSDEEQYTSFSRRAISQCSDSFLKNKVTRAMQGATDNEIDTATDVLKQMLQPKPEKRISPSDLAKHKFFEGYCLSSTAPPPKPTRVRQLLNFLGIN